MSRWSALALLVLSLTVGATAGHAQKGVAPSAEAASAGVCETGTAEADLDIGGVRARLYDIGGLFGRGSGATYEVPKGSGLDAIFSAGLWIGGMAEGELRFAGSTYGPWEYWPGPLDAAGDATAALCTGFDRIWVVSALDLAAYADAGTTTPDLVSWPVGVGAPFYVDADSDGAQGTAEPTVALRPGDAGYDPARVIDLGAGERPVVFGAQTAWWVMNDRGGPHDWSEAPALGLEVRVTAWAVADDDRPDLYHSTFYRYDILNRSGIAIEDARLGLFADVDLGLHNDDYVHTDPDRSMLVVYNADEFDDGGGGYGSPPPALGIDVLSGADVGMFFSGGGTIVSDPGDGQEAYTFLDAVWKDGTPLTVGGDGYLPGDTERTRWAYTGDPVARAFWSEENTDGAGRANTPSDRRGLVAAHVDHWAAGEARAFDVGLLFAQGNSRLGSVERVREASDVAQAEYASGGLFRMADADPPPQTPPPPSTAPGLLGPSSGAVFDERPATFEWSASVGATGYRLEISQAPDFERPTVYTAAASPLEVPPGAFPSNQPDPFYWRVVPSNGGSLGPPSEVRRVTLYRYAEGPLTYSGGLAFVEVVGPGGADPCGPQAVSTFGCDEGLGNGVHRSLNSTGDYVLRSMGGAAEYSLGAFAPSEFEVRFTAEGSYAYDPFAAGTLIRVPFEVWDIGQVTPGEANDPADDVQLIPALSADGAAVCAFEYPDRARPGPRAVAPAIYAYHGDYAAFEAEAAPLVAADPDACPDGDAAAAAWAHSDPTRRPLEQVVLEQHTERGVGALEGSVIRFYTIDRVAVAEADRPASGGALGLRVFPNPTARGATVTFAVPEAGRVRLTLVDVLGREVAVLAAGARAAGDHRAALDASQLAPGVYVVVLQSGAAQVARTVTVAR